MQDKGSNKNKYQRKIKNKGTPMQDKESNEIDD